ncbi:MAG: electron transport complex subunit RsxE [Proteobacteria bacterium]|nr:electron transport complex subunit RsxE [Pseudomonadota bacterium]
MSTFSRGVLVNNPAWAQLLGLCPLLAVSNSVVNALGLALASGFVLVGSNLMISLLRHRIPDVARLPCFVLIIATFTTLTVMILEAFAFTLYLRIALFIQIIVTNCMILGRAESFASRQPVGAAVLDALGTALGFAIALLVLGAVREMLGHGTLLREMDLLFGEQATSWTYYIVADAPLPLALFPPGAFLLAGLLFALVQSVLKSAPQSDDLIDEAVDERI